MASDPLTCRQLVELVTDYLEWALPALDRARVEAHLARCPPCRTYLAQVRQTIGWLAGLPADTLAPTIQRTECAPPSLAQGNCARQSGVEGVLRLMACPRTSAPSRVLADVTCAVRAGERVVLVGPNGATKTTLLKITVGTQPPDETPAQAS